jgi:hypothetical protein
VDIAGCGRSPCENRAEDQERSSSAG